MLCNLIIKLYRAAQGMAVDEFQEFSMRLLNSFVPFDSARYGSGTLMQPGLQIQEFFLHNKPMEAILDYAAIAYIDPVLSAARSNPGRIIRFHPPTLFSGKENRPLFDYAQRYEHANGMSAVHIDHGSQQAQTASVFSVFRADEDSHFLENDCRMIEQVLPHLLEALKVNQALAIHRSVKDADCSTVAIARQNGALHFCGTGFRKLVNIEWPEWEGAILPGPLRDESGRIGSKCFSSANIRVVVNCVGELLFLKASRISVSVPCLTIRPELLQSAYGLTPAEARVAIALLEGSSAKGVANYLHVSPHTVRTQIRQIYAKFGVGTRVRFVKLMLELAQQRQY